MKVRDIMSKDVAVCTPDTSLPEVARLMVEKDCGCIPVVDSRETAKPRGVVTDRDICSRVVAEGQNSAEMTARDCMSTPCVTVTPETTVDDCCRTLEDNRIRRAVVVDDSGRCCGMVAQADIARKADEREIARLVEKVSEPSPTPSSVGR